MRHLIAGFLVLALFPLYGESDLIRELGVHLSHYGYGATRVNNSADNNQSVLVEINGRKVSLTVDTGSGQTCLTYQCARELKLDVVLSKREVSGVGGLVKGQSGVALVKSFTLNGYELNRTNLIEVLSKSARSSRGEDGLLGYDFLHLNAVILPIGARILLFKPGNGAVAGIKPYMEALGFKSIPLYHDRSGLKIEGRMNGHPFAAIVDSGAEFSTFDLDYVTKVAEAAVTSNSIGMRGIDGRESDVYGFTPKQLSLGGITIKPGMLGACRTAIFTKEKFNALIGYDILLRHEAIIDLGHDVLWMK